MISLCTPLSQDHRIGICAPAGSFDIGKFNSGLQVIQEMGFEVYIPEAIYAQKNYTAGSDEQRAFILQHLFLDKTINCIVCARGGYGSMRILSLLDFGLIRKHPKRIVGFSDITALLVTLYQQCNFITYHGPMVTTLSQNCTISRSHWYDVLTHNSPNTIHALGPTLHGGSAEGRLIGGNLTTLCHLLGTPYMPNFDNHIVFFEDIAEPVYKLDRMLTQMKLAGVFKKIHGLILGSFKNCGNILMIYDLFYELFKHDGIPMLAGFHVGHDTPNMTLPIGMRVSLDTHKQTLNFL
ncbi:MAG: LD-carboxypeptidase [Desulfobacterales bacterium]|nr:LD-carboxypeptidase [Desulfobacterales bacterium]